ncbi:MAG TPA: 30S ribosomal protein S8 [Planctomycetota bacterium]|jgi:small subunit ribosomal protein S8|nr:30S ribosomal protein S8 [Planctomycetota bacterium]
MSMTDPIADLLTRIRNANSIKRPQVDVPASNVKRGMVEVLKNSGYIRDYRVIEGDDQATLRIFLKYGPDGEHVINKIERVSKPGRRVYRGVEDLPRVLNGLGISILSTSKGILSDQDARSQRLGGEVLAQVW